MQKISTPKCKMIVFSDIHYAAERPVNNGSEIDRKLTQYAIPLIHKLIEQIKQINPDIVINLGDLIEDSGNKETDLKDFASIWDLLKGIPVPFYSVIGNHDLRTMEQRKEIESIMGYDNATFSVDIKGYHFVFLTSDINNNPSTKQGGIFKTQFVSDKEITWLKQDLNKNTLPCLMFTHFGIAEDDMKGNWWFEDCADLAVLSNRKEIKDILNNDKNIIGVFSGHQHWTKTTTENGINYYVVGSLTEDMQMNGIPDGVFLEVDIIDTALKTKEHHLKI